MPHFTKNVDWLSLTFSHDFAFKRLFAFDEFVNVGRGLHGYSAKFQGLNTGIIVQNGSRDDMGTHVLMSGATLQSMRDQLEMTDRQICARMIDYGGRTSRIDLALTIIDGTTTPRSVHDGLVSGSIKAKARKHTLVNGANENVSGDTLYIGSRQSEKFFRCYDKKAELGLADGAAMVRLEMELKALHARAACHTVAMGGASAAVNTIIGDFLDLPHGEIADALTGEHLPFRSPHRPKSNTEKWLLGQVAKALARESMTNPDIVDNLLQEFTKYRAKLEYLNRTL